MSRHRGSSLVIYARGPEAWQAPWKCQGRSAQKRLRGRRHSALTRTTRRDSARARHTRSTHCTGLPQFRPTRRATRPFLHRLSAQAKHAFTVRSEQQHTVRVKEHFHLGIKHFRWSETSQNPVAKFAPCYGKTRENPNAWLASCKAKFGLIGLCDPCDRTAEQARRPVLRWYLAIEWSELDDRFSNKCTPPLVDAGRSTASRGVD